jgi:hypothetical protein
MHRQPLSPGTKDFTDAIHTETIFSVTALTHKNIYVMSTKRKNWACDARRYAGKTIVTSLFMLLGEESK